MNLQTFEGDKIVRRNDPCRDFKTLHRSRIFQDADFPTSRIIRYSSILEISGLFLRMQIYDG